MKNNAAAVSHWATTKRQKMKEGIEVLRKGMVTVMCVMAPRQALVKPTVK